jgi:hypothetical protein
VSWRFPFLFIKRYDRTNKDRPLEFLLARRVDQAQTVRSLLAKLRGWVPGLPEQDEEVEVYEEVTPNKVTPLSLDQTLEQSDLINGDIICIQRASAELDAEEWCYNTPSLPHHVPGYFSYLLNRRVVRFRPRTRLDAAKLRECVPFIEQSGLEHKGRCRLERDRAGEAVEVVLELSCQSTCRQVQEELHRWLQPVVRDPLQLWFMGRGGEVLTEEQVATQETLLIHVLHPNHNPYSIETVGFEIRPLSSVLEPPPVVSTPPESSLPVASAPVHGPADPPLASKAAEPDDDWLEGVEHTARAGKPKKKGKKGKKGDSKGRGRGGATVEVAEGNGGGPPESNLKLSDDDRKSIATGPVEPLDELEWLKDKADPDPARKARRKRKKGKKRRGQGGAAVEEAQGKAEGPIGSEGEQSDEDGGEEGAGTEDRPALHAHGGGDGTVEAVESETEVPAPASDAAGGDMLAGEAEIPTCASGPAGGEQVMSCLTPVRYALIRLSVTVVGVAGGGGRARVRWP